MAKGKASRRLRERIIREDGLSHGYHSRAYHRHFEGYLETEITDVKGRTRIRRDYVGEWYSQNLSRGKRIALKTSLAALWALTAAVFFFTATRGTRANASWYMAISEFGVVAGFLWTFVSLVLYLTAPVKMTIGDYRSASKGVLRGSLCIAGFSILTTLLTALHAILGSETWAAELLCCAGFLAAAALAVLMNRLEANVPYIRTPSTEEGPEDGVLLGDD